MGTGVPGNNNTQHRYRDMVDIFSQSASQTYLDVGLTINAKGFCSGKFCIHYRVTVCANKHTVPRLLRSDINFTGEIKLKTKHIKLS